MPAVTDVQNKNNPGIFPDGVIEEMRITSGATRGASWATPPSPPETNDAPHDERCGAGEDLTARQANVSLASQ